MRNVLLSNLKNMVTQILLTQEVELDKGMDECESWNVTKH